MNKLFSILLLAFSISAFSEDRTVTFSSYDPALKHDSVNEYETHIFKGSITITGILFFEFDMGGEKAVGVLRAQFVPDAASIKRLPNVVAGPHFSPIEEISLESPDAALESAFGKEEAERLKHGSGVPLKIPAAVELHDFLTDIECDSRQYWSTSFIVKPIKDGVVSTNVQSPHGC